MLFAQALLKDYTLGPTLTYKAAVQILKKSTSLQPYNLQYLANNFFFLYKYTAQLKKPNS